MDPFAVIHALSRATRGQNAFETFIAKRVLHRVDQRDTQFSISFRKQMIGFTRESPELRRPANRHRSFFRGDQPFALQGVKMWPAAHGGEAKPLRELRRINRTV